MPDLPPSSSPTLSIRTGWARTGLPMGLALWVFVLALVAIGRISLTHPQALWACLPVLALALAMAWRGNPEAWRQTPVSAPLLAAALVWAPGAWAYWAWSGWLSDPNHALLVAVWLGPGSFGRAVRAVLELGMVAAAWTGLALATARMLLEWFKGLQAARRWAGKLAGTCLLLALAFASVWMGQSWALVSHAQG